MKGVVCLGGVVLLLVVAEITGAATFTHTFPGEWSSNGLRRIDGDGVASDSAEAAAYVAWLSARDVFDSTFAFTSMPGMLVLPALGDDLVTPAVNVYRGKTYYPGDHRLPHAFDFSAENSASLGARVDAADRAKTDQPGLYARITQDFVPIVPEPATALLLGAGMFGFLARRALGRD